MTSSSASPETPDFHPSDPADLSTALSTLAADQTRHLGELIARARRAAEIAAALDPGPLKTDAESRHSGLARAIATLLGFWHSLGGTVHLDPPPVVEEPLPPAPPLRLPVAAPAAAQPALQPVEPTRPPAPPHPAVETPARRSPPAPRPEKPPEPTAGGDAWVVDLGSILREIPLSSNTQEEMDAILRAANASFTRWASFPRPVQRALVGNLACRLRHLQDHLGVSGTRLDTAFRSLTRFSKSFQPGWVNGLTRGRGPAADSWADEGRTWWDQLRLSTETPKQDAVVPQTPPTAEEHLEGVRRWIQEWREAPPVAKGMCLDKSLDAIRKARDAGLPPTHPELCALAGEIYDHLDVSLFRALRQAIRDLEMADKEERTGEAPKPIPSTWPWWSHTVGRRALLSGGAPEEGHRVAIEEAFGFAALQWAPLATPEDVLSVRERVLAGDTDLVIVLASRISPDADRPIVRAAQEAGIPWVHVEQGQGVTRIRMAIERYLQPDSQPEP
ncbi:MAG: hypothetical protein JXB39_06185 [Deltaproteobacteria bacterium]|nr:hypothetical protein [Deltaproteobacteria bacterium]